MNVAKPKNKSITLAKNSRSRQSNKPIRTQSRHMDSKGVMILLNPKSDIEVESFEEDKRGRLIILETKVNGSHLILVNVYAPNVLSQQVQFFENVKNKLSKYEDEPIIIAGDFNCALTASDKVGGRPIENNKKCHRQNRKSLLPLFVTRRMARNECR